MAERRSAEADTKINVVQIDGLVSLKTEIESRSYRTKCFDKMTSCLNRR